MHDPGGAGGYLRSADRICIAVMFDISECLAEPYAGFFQIAIHYVGKYQSVGTERFEITVASTPKRLRRKCIPGSDQAIRSLSICIVEASEKHFRLDPVKHNV